MQHRAKIRAYRSAFQYLKPWRLIKKIGAFDACGEFGAGILVDSFQNIFF